MKKIYFILFLGLLLSCTQTHKNAPLQPVKVTVPAELQAYYMMSWLPLLSLSTQTS